MSFGLQTASGDTALAMVAAAATVSSGPIASAGQAGFVLGMAQVTAITGTSPTVVFSFDESNDGSSWTAMTGTATAAIAAAGSVVFFGKPTKQLVRVTATIGGTTPAVTANVAFLAFAD